MTVFLLGLILPCAYMAWTVCEDIREAMTSTEITATYRLDEALAWESCTTHRAPRLLYTIPEAHMIMQQYRSCSREQRAGKQAAWDVLVAAGRIEPDPGRA